MKTIKENKKHLWYVGLEAICPCCTSKLKIESEFDIEGPQRLDETMLGKPHWLADFECPVCNYVFTLRE